MNEDNKSFSVHLKISKPGFFLVLLFVLFLGSLYFLIEKPFYVILEPPFSKDVFTRSEEKSIITWFTGAPGVPVSRSYIWRKSFNIFADCCENLKTQDQIVTFLDKWLVKEGWTLWTEIGSPCAHLAEGQFLERGKDWFAYIPAGKPSLMDTPAVCVAVWPATSDNMSFTVLLATSNR